MDLLETKSKLEVWIRESSNLLAELAEHPLHQQVFSLHQGKITRPFAWGSAIYIVQIRERKEPRPLTFEEAQATVHEVRY